MKCWSTSRACHWSTRAGFVRPAPSKYANVSCATRSRLASRVSFALMAITSVPGSLADLGARDLVLAPATAQRRALRLAHPGGQLQVVADEPAEGLHAVAPHVGAAQRRVSGAEHEAPDAGELQRPRAHRARLHRGVERRAGDSGRTVRPQGHTDRVELSVDGDIALGVLAILPGAEDHVVANDHGADRPVAAREGLLGVAQGHIHILVVVGHRMWSPRAPGPPPRSALRLPARSSPRRRIA